MLGALIDYWYYTGNDKYNRLVIEALQFQIGEDNAFMPPNQTKNEGNDDQVFWGFAAMQAAEYKFPNPPADQPQWLALAQGVFNSQAERWDTTACNGGLRWQITSLNNGYNYKNTPSNGGFINLAARLYAYSGNQTFADWTVKVWDWMGEYKLIGGQSEYLIFDGADTKNECKGVVKMLWTYNAGMMLNAAAVMWNATGEQLWMDRTMGIWNSSQVFFTDTKVLTEVACERRDTCDFDQRSFKSYFIRFAAASTKWAPFLAEPMRPYFLATAQAAAKCCVPGDPGVICSHKWELGEYDGITGVGEQLCALQAMQSLLITDAGLPVTTDTGGTSKGDPTAGTSGSGDAAGGRPIPETIGTSERAGAGVLTAFLIVGMLCGTYWLVS